MYLRQLQKNPLRTKMLTSGVLSAAQEYLASWIANDVSRNGHYFSARVPKMLLYGMFVAAPLGHFLVGILQKIFAGRTSLKAKILQILFSNLIVRSPFMSGVPQIEPSISGMRGYANLKRRSPPSKTWCTYRRWPLSLARAPSIRFAPQFALVSCPS